MGSRRRRSRTGRAAGAPQAQSKPSAWRRFRRQLDSFGGPYTIAAIVGTLIIVGFLIVNARDSGSDLDASDADLLGVEVPISAATHINDPTLMDIDAGVPPAGGPHFPVPQDPGSYENPIDDGNAVHSLEHGMIWISYNPDLVTAEDLETLLAISGEFDNDVVLSPRPDNADPIAVTSWGRRLLIEEADADLIEQFIRTNVNRSPEPGVR